MPERWVNEQMTIEQFRLTLSDVAEGDHPCVLIDDAGTPGQQAGSDHLHPGRKTWVAVSMTASQVADVCKEMPPALDELINLTAATEFHFADIYQGSGAFKNVPFEMRVGVFEFMSYIFATYAFPVIVQTLDPRNIAEMSINPRYVEQIGTFDMTQPSDAALMFLLIRTRWYLRENRSDFATPAYVVMDEGFRPAGRCIWVPTFEDVFKDSRVYTVKSSEFCLIQLADFAAFSVARTQWLMTKGKRSWADDAFLPIIANIRLNTVNLPESVMDFNTWTPWDYERVIDEDRIQKGLRPYREGE